MEVHDLSYDPRDPYFPLPGRPDVTWALQIYTLSNVYGLVLENCELAETTSGARLVCKGLSWAGQQQRSPGRVVAEIQREGPVYTWHIEAAHAEPIKCIKLVLRRLPDAILAKGWWSPTSEQDEVCRPTATAPLRWVYPQAGQWPTAWACVGDGEGAVCISARDAQVREKRLYVYPVAHAGHATAVEFLCDADATAYGPEFAAPPVRLHFCASQAEINQDFADHMGFIESAYGLRRWDERPDVTPDLRAVRLVANLHGQHWTGYVFNTYDQMADILRFLAQQMPAEQVLAYLPGWEGRYYFQYPYFRPAEAMGGPAGFARLVETARELRMPFMPMFGAHGANVQLYPDWEKAAFKNRANRYVRLLNCPDWDGDRSGEDDQVFLNPGEPEYRQFLVDQISKMVSAYDLRIIYLDTTAAWFNDPRYNLYEGYKALFRELRARHPGLVICGEGWTDALLALFPINLSWMGVTRRFRYPQLLADYGRAIQHLNEGAPGLGSTGVYEGGYAPVQRQPATAGHWPSISFVDDTLRNHAGEVVRICHALAQPKLA